MAAQIAGDPSTFPAKDVLVNDASAKPADRPDEPSTVVLVTRAQRGDLAARELLFRRYLPRVRWIASLRMGAKLRRFLEIDDIVQEALMRVLNALDDFEVQADGGGTFCNWVATCVRSSVQDAWRRHLLTKKRGAGREMRFGDWVPADLSSSIIALEAGEDRTTPSALVRGDELAEQLDDALLRLSEHDREVIILAKLGPMSTAEIATTLGFSDPSNARVALHRALHRLEKLLGAGGSATAR